VNPAQPSLDPLKVPNLTPQSARILSMMGVRYLMTDVRDPRPPRSFRRVYRGRSEAVWDNTGAMPRAYVARSVERVDSPQGALAALRADGFNPNATTVLEQSGRPRPATGSVRFVHDDAEDVELEATLDRPGVVVLSDTWSDGWGVTVDGHDATPIRANYLYRAVGVPAGRHTIGWHYRPAAYTAGVAISALSALALLAAAVMFGRRARLRSRARSGAVPTPR
jgi:uncharacterized membrane protein YfhO